MTNSVKFFAEETRFKVAYIAPLSQSVFATSSLQPLMSILASHLIQLTEKPKPHMAMDECNFCRQKGS